MIISDISHLEVATEEDKVVGGAAIATSGAYASANGPNNSFTHTYTSTYASKSPYFYYYSGNNASSSASSSSFAD